MKYESIKEAMETEEGKRLYKVLAQGFDDAKRNTAKHVVEVMDRSWCYLGSTHHLEVLVFRILNSEATK